MDSVKLMNIWLGENFVHSKIQSFPFQSDFIKMQSVDIALSDQFQS